MSAPWVIALVFIVFLIAICSAALLLINARQRRELREIRERLRMDQSVPARGPSPAASSAGARAFAPQPFSAPPAAPDSFGEPAPFSQRSATPARENQGADPFGAWPPARPAGNTAWRTGPSESFGSFGAGMAPPAPQQYPGYPGYPGYPANPSPSPYSGPRLSPPASPPAYGAGSSIPAWISPQGAPLPWSPPAPRVPLSGLAREYQDRVAVQYDPAVDALQLQFNSCRMQSAEEVDAAFQALQAQVTAMLTQLGRTRAALLVDLAGLDIGDTVTQDWGRALRQFLEACCIQTNPGHFLIARYNSRAANDRPSLEEIQAAVTNIQVMTEASIQGFRSNIARTREEAVALLLRLRQLAEIRGY